MLLNPKIAYGMASASHCCQELRLAVLKSLSPLRVARSNSEDAVTQIQGPAVISQGTPGQLGPILPKRSQ
jgi:hypothetical protein